MQALLALVFILQVLPLGAEERKRPEIEPSTPTARAPLPQPKPVDPTLVERNRLKMEGLQDRVDDLGPANFFDGSRGAAKAPSVSASVKAAPAATPAAAAAARKETHRHGPPPGRIEALLDGLDKYEATRGLRGFLRDARVTYDMKRMPGVGAVYVTENDEIVIEEDNRHGSVATTLPTFFHESGHAQWQHMGLDSGVVENEFRAWSLANHLAYEMFKDGSFQKEFKGRLAGFEPHLDSLQQRRDRVSAARSAFDAAKGAAALTLYPKLQWTRLKEWVGAESDQGDIRNVREANPEIFSFIAQAHSYQEFCRGQTEFFKGIRKSYVNGVTIPEKREELKAELEKSRKATRTSAAHSLMWEGRYLLLMPVGRSRALSMTTGRLPVLKLPPTGDNKVGEIVHDTYAPYKIEIAGNETRRNEILKYRESFYFYDGILLDYGRQGKQRQSMEDIWMNVDAVFVNEDGSVRHSISGVSGDPHQVREAADVQADMAKLEKTSVYWDQWLADDLKWREKRPDYCSHPDIKKVFEWKERFQAGMAQ